MVKVQRGREKDKLQWWSILSVQRSHALQWCDLGTLIAPPV